jgi:hypothetical protein
MERRTEGLMRVGPTCVNDLEVGVHMCTSTHWIDAHGGDGKAIKDAQYVRSYGLHSCTCVCGYVLDRRA